MVLNFSCLSGVRATQGDVGLMLIAAGRVLGQDIDRSASYKIQGIKWARIKKGVSRQSERHPFG